MSRTLGVFCIGFSVDFVLRFGFGLGVGVGVGFGFGFGRGSAVDFGFSA